MAKRFDCLDNGDKLHVQTLAGIAHYDRDVRHSYEEAFGIMRKMRLDYPQQEEFFRRMVFNVVARKTLILRLVFNMVQYLAFSRNGHFA